METFHEVEEETLKDSEKILEEDEEVDDDDEDDDDPDNKLERQ